MRLWSHSREHNTTPIIIVLQHKDQEWLLRMRLWSHSREHNTTPVIIAIIVLQHKDEEWSHDLETDLCLLWDMAMEPDVVQLLMDHQFLELSAQLIKTTSVSRLTVSGATQEEIEK